MGSGGLENALAQQMDDSQVFSQVAASAAGHVGGSVGAHVGGHGQGPRGENRNETLAVVEDDFEEQEYDCPMPGTPAPGTPGVPSFASAGVPFFQSARVEEGRPVFCVARLQV